MQDRYASRGPIISFKVAGTGGMLLRNGRSFAKLSARGRRPKSQDRQGLMESTRARCRRYAPNKLVTPKKGKPRTKGFRTTYTGVNDLRAP
jgi:hypothetical protein